MTKLPSPNQEATLFARSAQQELSQLRSALRAAQDSIAGLSRAIKVPNVQPRRKTIRATSSGISPWLSLGASFLGAAASDGLTSAFSDGNGSGMSSFYTSPSQQGARMVAMTVLGQRVR